MSPSEMAWRLSDRVVKQLWNSRRGRDPATDPTSLGTCLTASPPSWRQGSLPVVSGGARERLLNTADALMRGEGHVFDCRRTDMAAPDWFLDPVTGKQTPRDAYCFAVDYRHGSIGEVKYIWELSRHHHLTQLAAAYALTGDARYAERTGLHLESWWERNPFLSGIHWASGIEVGVRLLAWVWIRRLLADWPGTPTLFDRNPVFASQLYHHQEYLSRLPSRFSSANNHLVAEMAGLFVAACALPWFRRSREWRRQAAAALNKEIVTQIFPSGIHRELASGYHAFVLELALVAAIEGDAAGHPLDPTAWERLEAMADATAAILDASGAPPRQGDCDDGTALLVDGEAFCPWDSLLATASSVFGALDWWPRATTDDLRTPLLTSLTWRRAVRAGRRPQQRPAFFPDAGMVILRANAHSAREIWCRCDSGPHGYLSTAAHAHADALSVELRYGGVDVLSDPGTYRYYCADKWRDYFRSTHAHNTLQLGGANQSRLSGPFLWTRQAQSRTLSVKLDAGELFWEARHDGYRAANPPALHFRRVRIDGEASRVAIEDEIESTRAHACRLAFHLGPAVQASLQGSCADLSWVGAAGEPFARIELPPTLSWRAIRGQEDPPFGWFSPSYGRKVPITALLGEGTIERGQVLVTQLTFEVRSTERAIFHDQGRDCTGADARAPAGVRADAKEVSE